MAQESRFLSSKERTGSTTEFGGWKVISTLTGQTTWPEVPPVLPHPIEENIHKPVILHWRHDDKAYALPGTISLGSVPGLYHFECDDETGRTGWTFAEEEVAKIEGYNVYLQGW